MLTANKLRQVNGFERAVLSSVIEGRYTYSEQNQVRSVTKADRTYYAHPSCGGRDGRLDSYPTLSADTQKSNSKELTNRIPDVYLLPRSLALHATSANSGPF